MKKSGWVSVICMAMWLCLWEFCPAYEMKNAGVDAAQINHLKVNEKETEKTSLPEPASEVKSASKEAKKAEGGQTDRPESDVKEPLFPDAPDKNAESKPAPKELERAETAQVDQPKADANEPKIPSPPDKNDESKSPQKELEIIESARVELPKVDARKPVIPSTPDKNDESKSPQKELEIIESARVELPKVDARKPVIPDSPDKNDESKSPQKELEKVEVANINQPKAELKRPIVPSTSDKNNELKPPEKELEKIEAANVDLPKADAKKPVIPDSPDKNDESKSPQKELEKNETAKVDYPKADAKKPKKQSQKKTDESKSVKKEVKKALTAQKNKNKTKVNPGSNSEEAPLPLATHWTYQYKDDLKGMLKRGYIRVLTTFNRTNFFLSNGEFYGFEYEILKDYEAFLNKNIHKKKLGVVLEFIPCKRDELLPKLLNGYGDIAAASLMITDKRRKKAAFTKPYLKEVDELVITRKDGPKIETLEDLSERKIHVRKSSNYYESLIKFNKILDDKGLPPVQIIPVDESLETEDILEMINVGAFDITICDRMIAEIWSEMLDNIQLNNDLILRKNGKIAWMIRKNAHKLKASLDRFLKNHKKGTLLGNIYFKRYYEENKWINNLLCMVEDEKIKEIRLLIQKYADRYKVEWPLIMAMAYQESRFDHSTRSRQGAVGIMQVRPATARDKNIGIKNIDKLENNIHAGIKYLVFLKDRYFNSPEIKERDKMRFALAAYNLGPAKLQKARDKAQEMGLDPNRWFRNVENGTLALYGQETVRFVSNINRYYLKYRLALENQKDRQSAQSKALQDLARNIERYGK